MMIYLCKQTKSTWLEANFASSGYNVILKQQEAYE